MEAGQGCTAVNTQTLTKYEDQGELQECVWASGKNQTDPVPHRMPGSAPSTSPPQLP